MLAVLTVNSVLDNTPAGDGLVTLREAVAAANANTSTDLGQTGSGADTIQFAAELSGAVNLSTIGDSAAGASALLVSSPITVQGNAGGITIQRGASAAEMRLFRVAANGSLTLESIMLTGGLARGSNGTTAGENGGEGRGGAIYNEGALAIVASTLYGNQAIGGDAGEGGNGGQGRGGAVYNNGGTLAIRNATFSGNSVAGGANSPSANYGGAIYGLNGLLTIHNSTITNGTASTGRGVYVLAVGATATAHIYSTIIAQADAPTFARDFVGLEDKGGVISLSGENNFIRTEVGFPPSWNTNPLLGPLDNNGGPTLTHALLSGSPAIDTGSNVLNLTADGRGAPFARVVGGTADIGAFEVQSVAAPVLPGDYNRDNVVNAADYVIWRKTLNSQVEMFSGADGSGNSVVDSQDHEVWAENFGETFQVGSGSAETSAPASPAPRATGGVPLDLGIHRFNQGNFARRNTPSLNFHNTPALADQAYDEALLVVLKEDNRRPGSEPEQRMAAGAAFSSSQHTALGESINLPGADFFEARIKPDPS